MKGGIVCQKKEMTKMRVDGKFQAVSILTVVPQDIVRYKTTEKDGYDAVVVGLNKKKSKKDQEKTVYKKMMEFKIDGSFSEKWKP
jgi:large subunit ribosomal protein L3